MNFKFLLAVFVVAVALMPTAHSNRGRNKERLKEPIKERLKERLKEPIKERLKERLKERPTMVPGGFIIAAGQNTGGLLTTTEKFVPFFKESCSAGDIPEPRRAPSFCNNLLCGGDNQKQSCLKFDGVSTWEPVPVQLNRKRYFHLCWGLPSGAVLLLGGEDIGSLDTTELVSADRTISTQDFTLPYDTFNACGVEIGDKFIVTGGETVTTLNVGINTVAEYSQSGFVQYLTPMNTARRGHACSTYVTDKGDVALMVAGGNSECDGCTSTVEIMVKSAWSYAAPLPVLRFYAPAATLQNSVSVFGGASYTDKYNFFDEIFTYNAALNTWNITGHLSQPRAWHVAATLAVAGGVCT